jgi:hypothetical protein
MSGGENGKLMFFHRLHSGNLNILFPDAKHQRCGILVEKRYSDTRRCNQKGKKKRESVSRRMRRIAKAGKA